jgi:hypothetical protein
MITHLVLCVAVDVSPLESAARLVAPFRSEFCAALSPPVTVRVWSPKPTAARVRF